ncbi:transcription repressor OFP13-like [Canna indica]|uniref:Transcription repressor n=1 Tax=Canna indica TaxID=4628 RepID=A0AAQ3KZW7_9LILI|nr:transcription repressor OFP13-like [Canna indica]
MGKVAFTSLFYRKRETSVSTPPTSWLWPSCKYPMTHSFRKEGIQDSDTNEVFDGLNSSHLDLSESCFFDSSETDYKSFSSASEASSTAAAEAVEAVAHGIKSDRLFFEPGSTSSIMEETAKAERLLPLKGSIAMELDSQDPYCDFRLSMEEVVMAHGVMEVEWLEKMLCWYLKMNAERYHGLILEAFLDLLLCLVSPLSF